MAVTLAIRGLSIALITASVMATPASPAVSTLMRLRGGGEFKEKATGIMFPETIKAGGNTLKFLGAGERKKAILGPIAVNVYAIGLYVDEAAAKKNAASVKDTASAAAALLDGSFPKSLRLVMARTVAADKIGDALAEQLEPRVKGTNAPVGAFKDLFKSMASLETNQEVIFTQNGSTLQVKAPTATKDLASAPLCHALFDIYLGSKPVSNNAKNSMAEGLLKLVAAK